MIAPQGSFSADVQLLLHAAGETYELGQLGPGFALFREPQSIEATEAEIETIVDDQVIRRWIRLTSPITGQSRRFAFEALSSDKQH